MKIKICDICYYRKNEMKKSRWRISFRDRLNHKRLALDVCEEHKEFFKGFKSFKEADEAVDKLYS